MTDLFSAYEVLGSNSKLHAYLIGSTAPVNVDDHVKLTKTIASTFEIPINDAIEKIADTLSDLDTPTLVICVHVNSPREFIFRLSNLLKF